MTSIIQSRRTLCAAGVCGVLAVAIGAFGAHGLGEFLAGRGLDAQLVEKRLGQFDVAARYHLAHAVALLAISALQIGSLRSRRIAATAMVAGIVLFSGSLYLLVLTNQTWLGAVTPLGGLSWIVGWTALALGAFQEPQASVDQS